MERRHFLMSTAAATGAMSASALASPNDTVRVACVGIRGQGNAHIGNYARMKNVEIAALCDVDSQVLNTRADEVVNRHGKKKPALYADIRKLLENKDIDVVSIATPNHWHALMTIWALQAGKDVYCEARSHNIFESKQIVARRKYGRIVAHGTNSRSSASVREAKRQIDAGLIGDVYMTRALIFKWRNTIGKAPVEPAPSYVDYDLWTGPAPKRPFTKNRFHYNWHWFWDTGNGDIGNQGIHEVDLSRWLMGVDWPTKVSAIGGKFMFDDDQETPNTITSLLEFDVNGKKKMMAIDVRHWTEHNAEIGTGVKKSGAARKQHRRQHLLRLEGLPRHRRLRFLLELSRPGAGTRTRNVRRRQQLAELHRRRAQPRQERTGRAHRRRRHLLRPHAPRQHQLPSRPHPPPGSQDPHGEERPRSREDVHPHLPQAVCGPGESIISTDANI